jgi:hypothetical protein
MNFLDKLFKRSTFPLAKHEIKYAFTVKGVEYFQFADFNNIPALRGLKTTVFYEEMRCKCTVDFLKLHTEAIDNLLLPKPGKSINVYEIKKLNDQLKQRLDLALDIELAYKIASVVFFDKKENVTDYDYNYNAKKIAFWKANSGVQDFFLQQPLIELLPVLKDMQGNLSMYSLVVEKLNSLHLDTLLANLPQSRTQQLKGKFSMSLGEMPASTKT